MTDTPILTPVRCAPRRVALGSRVVELAAMAFLFLELAATGARAGGGGQNFLMVVNPGDENALRIATAYQRLRRIPDRNIVFYDPPDLKGHDRLHLTETALDDFLLQVDQAIATRGLGGQIDYIGFVGMPIRFRVDGSSSQLTNHQSTGYALMNLTQYRGGVEPLVLSFTSSGLYQGTEGAGNFTTLNYAQGENSAIHHDEVHEVDTLSLQYYMAGAIGYTGMFGVTVDQVIANLERSAGCDGSRPAGTIYFEENDDIRSNAREHQWLPVQLEMTARGRPFVEESNVSGSTPKNRADAMGAVVGSAFPLLPNGTNYLPGSWADTLTSFGANFFTPDQVKAPKFLAAGAGGSSGTVVEPFAMDTRFPDAAIHLFIADGSTLGEAFYKAVEQPLVILFFGDLLAQPFADLPVIEITSAPVDGATVSGSISIASSVALDGFFVVTTGVSQTELYIDGLLAETIPGDIVEFTVDTTTLSDGFHEFRVVAVNDTQAASESSVIRHYRVNNHGRSVVTQGALGVPPTEVFPVSAIVGDGTVSRLELRSMGRVLGHVRNIAAGFVIPDPAMFPYGDSSVTPVAVFTDGQEVAGAPITYTREPDLLPGGPVTPVEDRVPGFRADYFLGKGGASIAASDFSGPPDVVQLYERALLRNPAASSLAFGAGLFQGHTILHHATDQFDNLALRLLGRFRVDPGEAGEYAFLLYNCNDSVQLNIDGVNVFSYDDAATGISATVSSQGSVFLGEGEHIIEYLAANRVLTNAGADKQYFDVAIWMRGPDGVTKLIDDATAYLPAFSEKRIRIGARGVPSLPPGFTVSQK